MSVPTWPERVRWRHCTSAPPASAYLTGLIEPGVTGLVTVAPMPFNGGIPFILTPFGLIYYGLVSPIIWLLKDLQEPALIEQDPNAQAGKHRRTSAQLLATTTLRQKQDPEAQKERRLPTNQNLPRHYYRFRIFSMRLEVNRHGTR